MCAHMFHKILKREIYNACGQAATDIEPSTNLRIYDLPSFKHTLAFQRHSQTGIGKLNTCYLVYRVKGTKIKEYLCPFWLPNNIIIYADRNTFMGANASCFF